MESQRSSGGTYVHMDGNRQTGSYGQLDEEWMAGIDIREQERQLRLLERLATARHRPIPNGDAMNGDGDSVDMVAGSSAEFLCGLSLGFCLGAIMVFVLWELRMSRQQRLGIIMGIVANGLFGIVRTHAKRVHQEGDFLLAMAPG